MLYSNQLTFLITCTVFTITRVPSLLLSSSLVMEVGHLVLILHRDIGLRPESRGINRPVCVGARQVESA